MWFEVLTGFREQSPEQVRSNLVVEGKTIRSLINGKTFTFGRFETPSLAELKSRAASLQRTTEKLTIREVVADVQSLHSNPSNAGAFFQVASQFNTLEMISPNITPEQGIDRYEYDHTQGPICAIAAGMGTIYRNYFATVNGQTGQTATNQIDCLADMGKALNNSENRLWNMTNGYALAHKKGLSEITATLKAANLEQLQHLRDVLRIGLQWHTDVTIGKAQHNVTQAYCSALPVAYSQHSEKQWSAFAQIILEASYEATLYAALLNFAETGNKRVYLTLIGGGAFGNKEEWILNALLRSLTLHQNSGLDVIMVSYHHTNHHIQELIRQFNLS